jgi:hypothetical protein
MKKVDLNKKEKNIFFFIDFIFAFFYGLLIKFLFKFLFKFVKSKLYGYLFVKKWEIITKNDYSRYPKNIDIGQMIIYGDMYFDGKKFNFKNFKDVNKDLDKNTKVFLWSFEWLKYLKDVDTIKLGDYIKSIDFTDLNGTSPSGDQNITVLGWDGTLEQTSASLVDVQSELEMIQSASVQTIYVRITLENGTTWADAPSCTYYFEESGSLSTRWDKVNKMVVGDKLVIIDPTTNELSVSTITNLEMEYAEKTIYALDFEPSDLFLVDVGDGLFGIMHNSCWCPWRYCGYYCRSFYCSGCSGRFIRK